MLHMPPPTQEELSEAIELGHEPSTVSVKGLLWFFVCFGLFALATHGVIYGMYHGLVRYEESQNVERSALTTVKLHPPEPRLQPTKEWHERTEPEDLALMRGRDNLEFVNRKWITEGGEIRIPDDVVSAVAAQGSTQK